MMRGKKVVWLAVAAALCVTCVTGAMIVFAQGKAENQLAASAGQQNELKSAESNAAGVTSGNDNPDSKPASNADSGQQPGQQGSNDYTRQLYKDSYIGETIAKAVCEKYGLDYETTTVGQITSEMMDYESALWVKQKMGSRPVLGDSKWGDPDKSTLQVWVNDIHAFGGSAAIIEDVCRQAGLDPSTAVINDLTLEQLQSIMAKALEISDHGKETE